MKTLLLLASAALLGACTTPYDPPVIVRDGGPIPGLAQLLVQSPNRELDVIVVHGMCTKDRKWANETIAGLGAAAQQLRPPETKSAPRADHGIDIVRASTQTPAGTIHFSAFIWSGLTAAGKEMLAYDKTGSPTDCARDRICTPRRAKLNGMLKDALLNDCLSDALIYQGARKAAINQAFIEAITGVIAEQTSRNKHKTVPLVLISESLGSKMTLDALNLMSKESSSAEAQSAVQAIRDRVSYLYMAANQLPILTLADQASPEKAFAAGGPRTDALSDFLGEQIKRTPASKTTVVAFTDPNDQLSYRLMPEHYANRAVIKNVLVSNATTYFGYFENPYPAHTAYLDNAGVRKLIMCGTAQELCR